MHRSTLSISPNRRKRSKVMYAAHQPVLPYLMPREYRPARRSERGGDHTARTETVRFFRTAMQRTDPQHEASLESELSDVDVQVCFRL